MRYICFPPRLAGETYDLFRYAKVYLILNVSQLDTRCCHWKAPLFEIPGPILHSWKLPVAAGLPPVLMLQNPTRMFMLNSDLRWGQGNFLPLEKWVWKRGVSNCDHKPFCAAEIRPKALLRVGLCLHACNNSTGLTLLNGIWIHNITMSCELFLILWDGWWSILTSTYTQGWALWSTTLNIKWQQMCCILYEGHRHDTVQNFFFLIDVEFTLFLWHFTVFSCNSVQITFVQFWSCRISSDLLFIYFFIDLACITRVQVKSSAKTPLTPRATHIKTFTQCVTACQTFRPFFTLLSGT